MGLISVVTSLTPSMVTVVDDGISTKIKIDQLVAHLEGATVAERLANLNDIGHKLLNAHDAIAAQERLFDAEQP
jgi:hypothetical protein